MGRKAQGSPRDSRVAEISQRDGDPFFCRRTLRQQRNAHEGGENDGPATSNKKQHRSTPHPRICPDFAGSAGKCRRNTVSLPRPGIDFGQTRHPITSRPPQVPDQTRRQGGSPDPVRLRALCGRIQRSSRPTETRRAATHAPEAGKRGNQWHQCHGKHFILKQAGKRPIDKQKGGRGDTN